MGMPLDDDVVVGEVGQVEVAVVQNEPQAAEGECGRTGEAFQEVRFVTIAIDKVGLLTEGCQLFPDKFWLKIGFRG